MKLTQIQRKTQIKAIQKAIKEVGGKTQLAYRLTEHLKRPTDRPVTRQNINDMLRVCCAAHWAIPIEKVSGVNRSEIHPVAYPPEEYAA